ncbi:MAG: M56 family metallopeptidase [Bythopirellula sp.]|nr:M56 family metallopeptidase [Bythopirellula sp.]
MNTLLTFWHLLGWTMLYFLAAGTLVLLISAALKVSLKRANPRVRYTTSLAVFAVLALLPMAIASWLTITQPSHQRPEFTTNLTNSTNQLFNAEIAEVGKGTVITTEGTEITEGKKVFVLPREETVSVFVESLLNLAVQYLPWLWCIGTPLTFLLLTSGLVGAERLRRSCQFLTDGPIHDSCAQLRIALNIGRQVGVAICERVATPVLVGVVKPLILLPPAALNGWTTDELEMVLLHELAHVRRWDNAVNLAQRIVESLLFFHPAVWIMSTWVRRDREDCCDAVVIGHTAKPQAYAELLLALASHTPGMAASAAMAQHPVANRIRRILKLEDEPMRVSRSTLTIVTSTAFALALALAFLGSTNAKETVSRESKRVGDERSGKELTTNPTNRTNKKLTTEVTESTEEEGKSIDKVVEPGKTMVQFFPHPTKSEVVDEAVKKLNKIGHNVTIRPTKNGTALLVENGTIENASAVFANFPTLEDQRAADIAYKLLGVELEKLDAEELKRVKAEGYAGGLRVTSEDNPVHGLRTYDLLLGLHVWPTESLDQVKEILTRDDLDQLSPLKFYVIRQGAEGPGRGSVIGIPAGADTVITGRTSVNLDAWRQIREQRRISSGLPYLLKPGDDILIVAYDGSQPDRDKVVDDAYSIDKDGSVNFGPDYGKVFIAGNSLEDARYLIEIELRTKVPKCVVQLTLIDGEKATNSTHSDAAAASLLYDGKTFEEWRELWTTELKTENRIECINALAAFGRAGKGQEAAEAILDVAGEYDFDIISDGSAGDLKQAITVVMVGNEGFPGQYWLPLLIDRLKSDPDKWSYFAYWVLRDVQGKDVIPYLKQLATDNTLSADARGAALAGLASQPDLADDAEALEMVREALKGNDAKTLTILINNLRFNRLDLFPEQIEMLWHENDIVRRVANANLMTSFDPSRGIPILDATLAVINNPERKAEHARAIYSLSALSSFFSNNHEMKKRRPEVNTKLEEILINGAPGLLPAALATLANLSASDESSIIQELGDRITDDRRELLKQAIKQAEELKSQDRGGGGGGRGGMGGGGGAF